MLRALRASRILKRKRNPADPLRAAGAIVGAILGIIPGCSNSLKPDRTRLSKTFADIPLPLHLRTAPLPPEQPALGQLASGHIGENTISTAGVL